MGRMLELSTGIMDVLELLRDISGSDGWMMELDIPFIPFTRSQLHLSLNQHSIVHPHTYHFSPHLTSPRFPRLGAISLATLAHADK